MKYSEKYVGSKKECFDHLKNVFRDLFHEKLEVEGEPVQIPNDKELEYKIKYEDDPEMEGAVGVKIAWSYIEEEEEEEDEDEDDEEDDEDDEDEEDKDEYDYDDGFTL